MNNDYRLLDEALRTLQEVRPWVSADYYKKHISEVAARIRTRLAAIEAEEFVLSRSKRYQETITKPAPLKNTIYTPETFIPEKEPDTMPNKLVEATTNFGIFTQSFRGEMCKDRPEAPHRYLKELSESLGRYVCQCEFWSPDV